MNALLSISKPRRAVRTFRETAGAMENWSTEDHNRFQNLLQSAHAKAGLLRARRRVQALAVIAYAMPLYTLAEVLHAVRGKHWHGLEAHLDRVDDWCTAAEDACTAAGDHTFLTWAEDFTDRVTDTVCRMSSHLARN